MRGIAYPALVIAMGALSSPGTAADLPAKSTAPSPLLSPALSGPASTFSFGPVIGLGGIGVQAGYRVNSQFGARASVAGLRYSHTVTADDLRVKSSSSFIRGTLYGDWYPFDGGFRLSAGLGVGRSSAKVHGEASNGRFSLGGDSFDAATEVGSVTGKATWNSVVPVLTVGYEALPFDGTPLTLSGDVGIAYIGKPKVKLSAGVIDTGNPFLVDDVNSALRAQEASVRRELGKFPVMPVLTVGALYRF